MRYALRRLGFFVFTLWAALTINFLLPRLMPGNPALAMLAKFHGQLTPQTLKALDILFGINTHKTLIEQYFTYLHQVLTFNFGISLDFYPKSVSSVIGGAIWWTVGLVGVTTVLAFVLGTGLGIVSAWRRGGKLDSVLPPVFVITSAIPYFWMGMVLVLIFGITLHWLPYVGGYNVSTDTLALAELLRGHHRARHPARGRAADHDHRHVDPDDAEHDDHHAGRGLREDGPGQGAAGPADHGRLRGP